MSYVCFDLFFENFFADSLLDLIAHFAAHCRIAIEKYSVVKLVWGELLTAADRSKKCVFDRHRAKVLGSVVLEGVLGPPHLSQNTCRCPCISAILEATHKLRLRELEGRCVSSKSLSRVPDETRELLGGMKDNNSLQRGH